MTTLQAAVWCCLERTRLCMVVMVTLVIAYCMPLYFDKTVVHVKDGDRDVLIRINNALSNNETYQVGYKLYTA